MGSITFSVFSVNMGSNLSLWRVYSISNWNQVKEFKLLGYRIRSLDRHLECARCDRICRILDGISVHSYQCWAFGRGSLAVASVAQCFKILYFLRAFESTGPLVSMIFSFLFDGRYFFLILGLILSGFSQAFWLISFGDEISDFGTIAKSLLNIFRYDGRS